MCRINESAFNRNKIICMMKRVQIYVVKSNLNRLDMLNPFLCFNFSLKTFTKNQILSGTGMFYSYCNLFDSNRNDHYEVDRYYVSCD